MSVHNDVQKCKIVTCFEKAQNDVKYAMLKLKNLKLEKSPQNSKITFKIYKIDKLLHTEENLNIG